MMLRIWSGVYLLWCTELRRGCQGLRPHFGGNAHGLRLYDGLMITGSSNGGWWSGEHTGACAVLPNASPCVSSHVVREHSSVCGTVGRRLLHRHTGSGRAFLRHSHIIAHIRRAFLSDVACDGSKVLSSCAPLLSHVLFVLFAYVPVVC